MKSPDDYEKIIACGLAVQQDRPRPGDESGSLDRMGRDLLVLAELGVGNIVML